MAASESPSCRTADLLQPDEYDEYSWMLLEDHPLRSHPTDCWPDVFAFLGRCYTALKQRWTERLFPVLCLFLMFTMVVQFIASLPYGVSHLLLRTELDELGAVQWPAEFADSASACLAYNPLAHDNAIAYAVDTGCTGVRADVWLGSDDELTVGAKATADATLQTVYLEPLLAQLDEANRDPAAVPVGVFPADRARSFVLLLELHAPLHEVQPRLDALLAPFQERGYLSYTNSSRVVSRPVTIVLGGDLSIEGTDMDPTGVSNSLFFDEPATTPMEHKHEPHTTHLPIHPYTASTNFTSAIGAPHRGRFSRPQLDHVRAQVRAAHARGARARFTDIPCHSTRLRRVIWRMLVREGADVIEVDWSGCQGRWWRGFITFGGHA
ncbi:hypothetical protein BJX96DRAFT_154165 [Aspergillus floccosus]